MYPHITESYACILKMFAIKFFDSFWNVLSPKAIKICYIFVTYIQSYPMSSNIRIFIKIYYICSISYFIG